MDLLKDRRLTNEIPLPEQAESLVTSPREASFRVGLAKVIGWMADLSLGVMVFLIPFRARLVLLERSFPRVYPDYSNLLYYAQDVFLIATLVFWVLSLAILPRRLSFKPGWLAGSLAGLTLISIFSVPFSVDRLLSLFQAGRLLLMFGLFLFLLNRAGALNIVLPAAAAQLVVQAVIGIVQVLQQHSLGLARFQEWELDPASRGVSIVWTVTARSLRAYGLTDHPNILGGCLALALIMLVVWYIKSSGPGRMVLGGAIALGLVGLLLSFSRSAWLGFAGGLAVIVLWVALNRRRDEFVHLTALGLMAALVIAPFLWQELPYVQSRLGSNQSFTSATPENQAIYERRLLIQEALALFRAHPLTGVGLSAFPIALRQAHPDYPFDFQPPHLVALDVAAETGIVGGVFFLLMVALPWVFLIRRIGRSSISLELAGISAALMALTIISLFDYYPWMLEPGRLWLWLAWGLWGNLYRVGDR